jgi:hypothetical protein
MMSGEFLNDFDSEMVTSGPLEMSDGTFVYGGQTGSEHIMIRVDTTGNILEYRKTPLDVLSLLAWDQGDVITDHPGSYFADPYYGCGMHLSTANYSARFMRIIQQYKIVLGVPKTHI